MAEKKSQKATVIQHGGPWGNNERSDLFNTPSDRHLLEKTANRWHRKVIDRELNEDPLTKGTWIGSHSQELYLAESLSTGSAKRWLIGVTEELIREWKKLPYGSRIKVKDTQCGCYIQGVLERIDTDYLEKHEVARIYIWDELGSNELEMMTLYHGSAIERL